MRKYISVALSHPVSGNLLWYPQEIHSGSKRTLLPIFYMGQIALLVGWIRVSKARA